MGADAKTEATQHPLHSSLEASIAPWSTIKVPTLKLDLDEFNPQAFWPQMPTALLSGKVNTSSTSSEGSHAQDTAKILLEIQNASPGPADTMKIPLTSLAGTLIVHPEYIQTQDLRATIGSDYIDIKGRLLHPENLSTLNWEADASLHRIDPHLIYSALKADRISGTVHLQQEGTASIAFKTNLTTEKANNIPQFKLKTLESHGFFLPQSKVHFSNITAKSLDASVQGNNVAYSLISGAVTGPLSLTAPGLGAQATFNALSPSSGNAQITLGIHSANQAVRWLGIQPVRLTPVIDFLKQVAKHEDNLQKYINSIPVLISGGWQHPQIGLDINPAELIAKIIQSKAKSGLLQQLDIPSKPNTGTSSNHSPERDALNFLGNIINQKR